MPEQPSYRSQVLDHLGLVAGMFEELGIGEVLDQGTRHWFRLMSDPHE